MSLLPLLRYVLWIFWRLDCFFSAEKYMYTQLLSENLKHFSPHDKNLNFLSGQVFALSPLRMYYFGTALLRGKCPT